MPRAGGIRWPRSGLAAGSPSTATAASARAELPIRYTVTIAASPSHRPRALGAADGPCEDREERSRLDVTADGRRAKERRGRRDDEAEEERDEDQDLRDPHLDPERVGARGSTERDELVHAPRDERHAQHGDREEDPQDAAARGLAHGEARDDPDLTDAHRWIASAGPASRHREEGLLERGAAGLDLVDPPAGVDDRGDEVRDPLGGKPANVSRSPSRVGVPKAARRSTGSGRSVTRRLTTGAPMSPSRPDRDDPATVEDGHARSSGLDLAEQMAVEHDRAAASGRVANDGADVLGPTGQAPRSARRG